MNNQNDITMKKSIIYIALLSSISIACSKESTTPANNGKTKVTFSAETETKSNLSEKQVLWAAQDYVAIWDGTTVNPFVYDTSTGKFTGSADMTSETIYAVFPYLYANNAPAMKFAETTIRTYIPSCQPATANSFSPYANLSACKVNKLSEDKLGGKMLNLCGYIKFTVSQSASNPIVKVRFSSPAPDSRKMSGLGTITIDGETISAEGNENNYVECATASTSNFELGNGTYIVTSYPANFSHGLTVTMLGKDGSVYEYKTKAFELKRNETANLGTIDAKLATDKTAKLCIVADFTGASNSTLDANYPASNEDKSFTVTMGETAYTLTTGKRGLTSGSGTKQQSGYALHHEGYISTPAIEGKVLVSVAMTWRSHSTNLRPVEKILNVNNNSNDYLAGTYKCINAGSLLWTNAENSYCLPYVNTPGNWWSITHLFLLGHVSSGEMTPSGTKYTPEANTKYYILNNGSASMLNYLELIYEPAE